MKKPTSRIAAAIAANGKSIAKPAAKKVVAGNGPPSQADQPADDPLRQIIFSAREVDQIAQALEFISRGGTSSQGCEAITFVRQLLAKANQRSLPAPSPQSPAPS